MLFAFVRFESVSCETIKIIDQSLIILCKSPKCLVQFQLSALKPKEFELFSAREYNVISARSIIKKWNKKNDLNKRNGTLFSVTIHGRR